MLVQDTFLDYIEIISGRLYRRCYGHVRRCRRNILQNYGQHQRVGTQLAYFQCRGLNCPVFSGSDGDGRCGKFLCIGIGGSAYRKLCLTDLFHREMLRIVRFYGPFGIGCDGYCLCAALGSEHDVFRGVKCQCYG